MKVTIVSDTHGQEPELPGGDLLVHCGDLTLYGFKSETMRGMLYLEDQFDKYKYIVQVPGNHELWIQKHLAEFKEACLKSGIIGLVNERVTLEGINIWGSPATLEYHNWAFNYSSKEIQKIWEKIPDDTDLLVTHSPPWGVLDRNHEGKALGCPDLLERVKEVHPQVHAFGHIHESFGTKQIDGILYINAATTVINVEIENK